MTQSLLSAHLSGDRARWSCCHFHWLLWLVSLSLLSGGLVKAQASPNIITPAALEASSTPVAPVVTEITPLRSVATDHFVAAPPLALPDPITAPKAAYIAPTNYSIGFTGGYQEPNAVVDQPQSSGSSGSDVIAENSRGIAARQDSYTSPRLSYSRYTDSRSTGSNVISFNATTTQAYDDRLLRVLPRLDNGNVHLIFPLSMPASITSLFGWRIHPISGAAKFHAGVDLGAPLGTPILAAYAGQVVLADWLGGYGLAITLGHNQDTQETLYAHLSEILVKPGQWVNQGQLIGRVGSTGNSTGPHLHFEFRQLTAEGWVAMNPGAQLEYALAQLVKALQSAQSTPQRQQG